MTAAVTAQPFFLSVSGRSRFCLYHSPVPGAALRGAVVYIHPFAEEMNFSRHMVALQSRALAAQGYAVLQIDLLGCGDSAGDFSEASWSAWVADIIEAARWMEARHRQLPSVGNAIESSEESPEPLTFWGLRAGCLLAAEAACAMNEPVNFLFWQPVLSGETYWRQFKRLEVAARALESHAGAPEKDANQVTGNSAMIEIAGYGISPALIVGLSASRLVLPASTRRVSCVELKPWQAPEQDNATPLALSPALESAVTAWREQGKNVCCAVVPGAAFWQIAEAEDCPALRAATAQLLMDRRDGIA